MKIFVFVFSFWAAISAQAKLVEKSVEYKEGEAVFEGYFVFDDSRPGKRPGVIVVHDWYGVGGFVKERARELAKLGYAAFAVDIYGKGVRPNSNQEAGVLAGKYKNDRPLMRKHALAGLEQIKKQPRVDVARLSAIGYCFGGTVVLELARAGSDLKGVASFHGGLSAPMPAEAGKVKAKIVAYHGAEDPSVPEAEVRAFEEEMRSAKVDWNLVKYANAVHAFTNPNLRGKNAMPGMAEYNETADRRSWASLQDYLKEWFQ